LQKLYTTKLENYGKKDYQVYADGLSKWQGKLGKAFEKRVKKCGDAYFSDESLGFVNCYYLLTPTLADGLCENYRL